MKITLIVGKINLLTKACWDKKKVCKSKATVPEMEMEHRLLGNRYYNFHLLACVWVPCVS